MDKEFHRLLRDRGEITVRYDPETEAIWGYSNPSLRPCYNMELLNEFRQLQLDIIDYFKYCDMKPVTPIKYFVHASQIPGIYNYGGDLNLFSELIQKKDADRLFEYAKVCIDIVYMNAVNLHLPITTIALVEGNALGGGFEGAISHSITIVEEQSQMGLPEIRFNLIPGMGAYSFLARSVGIKLAEEIIASGKVYDAATLHEMGVITQVVKRGEGEKAVNQYMKRNSRLFNGMQALQAARQRYAPLDYEELIDITKIWVDAALRLEPKDLKMMKKLVDAQNQKNIDMNYKLRTKQDRRFEKGGSDFPYTDSDGNIVLHDRRSHKDPRSH
ncbi:crotonase/enoyl-CoA hydratase family protein [Sulfurovum sp. NBC37-1]|uniref:crotonase/enoyl-CoA hydratase family protein n=1 Tax=Sulfurovum sp. (strain NBC37-1) TaxID=387093 RepID=UPI00015875E2|nr:crotonase/enoyl-CoA hydratase family protein [Sulfurovum sp. NBC37-1]BAF71518.1 enoyl-CoA hydratase/isomerase [Sulfurovum sp. NBC37-1]